MEPQDATESAVDSDAKPGGCSSIAPMCATRDATSTYTGQQDCQQETEPVPPPVPPTDVNPEQAEEQTEDVQQEEGTPLGKDEQAEDEKPVRKVSSNMEVTAVPVCPGPLGLMLDKRVKDKAGLYYLSKTTISTTDIFFFAAFDKKTRSCPRLRATAVWCVWRT